MAGETQITVLGNLTSDPEVRFTQGGLAVAGFTVASTPRTFDRQKNEFVDGEALFLRCSAWRELGEHVGASLAKGQRVIVQGNLSQRSYQTKEGEKRSSMELDVTAIGPDLRYGTASFRKDPGKGQGGQAPQRAAADEPWAPQAPQASAAQAYNDETPF